MSHKAVRPAGWQARTLSSADGCSGLRRVVPCCAARWRDKTNRALCERSDGQAGIHTEVRSQHRTIANVHVAIPEDAMPAVNHSSVWRICHDAASDAVRRPRHIEEDFGSMLMAAPPADVGEFGCKLVRLWDISRRPARRDWRASSEMARTSAASSAFLSLPPPPACTEEWWIPAPIPTAGKAQRSNRIDSKRTDNVPCP